MVASTDAPTGQITLSDLYPDGLSEAQARRIVALLRLTQPRRAESDDEAA